MLSLDDIIQLNKELNGHKEQSIAFYRNLSTEEGQWLANQALRLFLVDRSLAENILSELACFVPGSLKGLHELFIERDILFFYPRHIFNDADSATQDSLIAHVADNPNRNLYALAWIGSERVQQYFAELRADPPKWRDKLYVPPENYSYESGWELNVDGKRRDLFYREAHRLVKKPSKDGNAICPFETLEERCVQCGNKLVILFDFDLTLPELNFMQLHGSRLRIKTCLYCSCYVTMASDVDLYGKCEMRPDNQPATIGRPIEIDDSYDWSVECAYLGEVRRTPYECLSSIFDFQSQVGGHPFWWNDAHYPKCPVCQQSMPNIAQIEVNGLYYAHLCTQCGVVSVHYQNS